jgi:hypothetical protein
MSDPALELDVLSGDPLMPVDEVARWLGVAPTTVASHVIESGMRSLDDGTLIAAGDRTTPLIRSREVRRFMREQLALMKGPRPQVPTNVIENTPALTALAFVLALQDGDIERVWDVSSAASREASDSKEDLAAWWSEYLDIENAPDPGISSGIYSIGERALAVMYIADTVPSGGVLKRAAMVTANPLALVEEEDGWRVDQPLQARCKDWRHLVGALQSPSEAEGGASGSS